MSKKAIFIAATGQNVGKTTLCLGIFAALKKRFSDVGFIKPVGQRHVKVDGITVDKDTVLFKEHFHLKTSWQQMSPVIIPSGFTKDFLDQKITEKELLNNIRSAFEEIREKHAYTLVEGTGHVGVGSIINLNNAQVAAELGLETIIIASAGLGSTYDELALNVAMCKLYGVKIRGVILNRVHQDKRNMILEYFPKTLRQWGIPLIGTVPYNDLLSSPTMQDFETLFDTSLLSGQSHHYRRFRHVRLIAGSVASYEAEILDNQLIITPASREDIITRTLEEHRRRSGDTHFGGGMILTGRHPPVRAVLEKIRDSDLPILYAPLCSYDAMKMITSLIAKIRMEDLPKVAKAIELVEANVDIDAIANTMR